MAITTAVCNSFKTELLAMTPHAAGNTYKLVLIKTGHSGTYNKSCTSAGVPGTGAPSTSNVGTDACAASGTYAVAGFTLSGFAAALDTDTATLDFADPAAATGTTISADGCMIYNDTAAGKNSLSCHAFAGAPIISTAGNFTVTLPAATAAAATIRIA
jgi:hypothetical protein